MHHEHFFVLVSEFALLHCLSGMIGYYARCRFASFSRQSLADFDDCIKKLPASAIASLTTPLSPSSWYQLELQLSNSMDVLAICSRLRWYSKAIKQWYRKDSRLYRLVLAKLNSKLSSRDLNQVDSLNATSWQYFQQPSVEGLATKSNQQDFAVILALILGMDKDADSFTQMTGVPLEHVSVMNEMCKLLHIGGQENKM